MICEGRVFMIQEFRRDRRNAMIERERERDMIQREKEKENERGEKRMLHEFLVSNRNELVARCKAKVISRPAPRSVKKDLHDGIPLFLTQLTEILREESLESKKVRAAVGAAAGGGSDNDRNIGIVAGRHGNDLLLTGFNVDQVVHEYGDLCQAVTELAIERDQSITNNEFRTLNRCLDDAIAGAVSEFARGRDRVITDASENTLNERMGFLAHEFRNLVSTAMLAAGAIKGGHVGISGSTAAILDRSLQGLRNLCDRVLVDVRLKAGIPMQRERVVVSELIEEIEVSASMDAEARGLDFMVSEVAPGLTVEVDRTILAGAVNNLLQNAFKFTKPHTRVELKAFSSGDRVLIEVEDECGGLPTGDTDALFRVFEQQSTDRSGLGLGLSISRSAVEANGGLLNLRDLPGSGCVFTIDLPKA